MLARRETPMTAQEIADELARLALKGQRIAVGITRERGHCDAVSMVSMVVSMER